MTKSSFVVCLLLSIFYSTYTNLLQFLLVQKATFSWCKPPGLNSDQSAFLCHFILVCSPFKARKGKIKDNWNSSLLIFVYYRDFSVVFCSVIVSQCVVIHSHGSRCKAARSLWCWNTDVCSFNSLLAAVPGNHCFPEQPLLIQLYLEKFESCIRVEVAYSNLTVVTWQSPTIKKSVYCVV